MNRVNQLPAGGIGRSFAGRVRAIASDGAGVALVALATGTAAAMAALVTFVPPAAECPSSTAADGLFFTGAAPGVALSAASCVVALVAGVTVVGKAARNYRRDTRQRVGAVSVRGGDADPAVLSLVEEQYETVPETHRRLSALERLFRARGDQRAVFLTVYARVTGEVASAIENGTFENPQWVAEYLVTFANFYRRALYHSETGREHALSTAWRLAFRAAEREETLTLQHAALGINAHVTYDLAYTLFTVGVGGGQRSKYHDHHRINLVLWSLVDVSLTRLAERYAPGIATLERTLGPLVKLGWFGALLVGREAAWWAALVMAESDERHYGRAAQFLVATTATLVARIVVGPTANLVTATVTWSIIRRLGLRGL